MAHRVGGYDPMELRRLIGLSFTSGELSKFAERWRVFIDRDGTPDDAARALVRAIQTRDKLPQLVESLRAHKPLVEWPEPQPDEPGPDWDLPGAAATAPGHAPPGHGLTPPAGGVGIPATAPGSSPVVSDHPSSSRAPLVDPFLVDPTAPEPTPHVIPPWVPLAGMLAGGVLVGVIGMWIVSGDDEEEVREETADKPSSLAVIAASELERSVSAVREACKVKADDSSARDVLRAAFDSCSVPEIRPGVVAPDPVPDPRPSQVDRRPPPRAKSSPDKEPECLDRCHGVHAECKDSECGQEPSSAADYDSYQRCLSSCMSKYTRCRLTCR